MIFCPKCGSILLPKKEGSKTILKCSCGYKSSQKEDLQIKEKIETPMQKMEVVEKEIEILPKTGAKCRKCGNNEAYFWEVQTRAADEPPTRFFRCTKCRKIWRSSA